MPRGGMRCGAGRRAYSGKAEACMRLDVREWARRGKLSPGYAGSWSWSNSYTGEHTGSTRCGARGRLRTHPRTRRGALRRWCCSRLTATAGALGFGEGEGMPTIERRVTELERTSATAGIPLLLILEHSSLAADQRVAKEAAERGGRRIILVRFVEPDRAALEQKL
jgi:hypothetical protein